jgi:hypothetical protein
LEAWLPCCKEESEVILLLLGFSVIGLLTGAAFGLVASLLASDEYNKEEGQ